MQVLRELKELFFPEPPKLMYDCSDITYPGMIRRWGSMNLFHVGDYTRVLYNSLKHWVYTAYAQCYLHGTMLDKCVVLNWVDDECWDPDILIRRSVEDAYTDFLQVVEDFMRKSSDVIGFEDAAPSKPDFGICTEYDLHELPNVLRSNEYLNMEPLVIKVFEVLGGESC